MGEAAFTSAGGFAPGWQTTATGANPAIAQIHGFVSPGPDTTPAPKGGPPPKPELEQTITQRGVYGLVRQSFGDIAPSTVASILKDFERGRLTRPADLAARVLRDPDIRTPYRVRRAAVAGRPWTVKVPDDCPAEQLERCKAKATYARRALNGCANLEESLMQGLDAIGMGIHIHETEWGLRDGWWMPKKLHPVLTREVWLDSDWTPIVRDAEWRFHRTSAHPGKFWVHRPATEAGILVDNALFAAAFTLYMVKTWMLRFWLVAAERFGTPLALGTVAANAPEPVRKALKAALKDLTADSIAVAPDGSTITIYDAKGEASGRIYSSLAEWMSAQNQILFVGSTSILNPGPNGSRSAEEVRNGVRLETTAQDARMMWSSFSRDVLEWGYAYNGLSGGVDPIVETVLEQEPGTITVDMIDAGVVTENELRAAGKLPARAGGDRIAVRKPPPAAAPTYGAPAATDEPAPAAASTSPPIRKPTLGGMPDLESLPQGLLAALAAERAREAK